MENEYFSSKRWIAKQYKTASELDNFIHSIRDKIIGKKIDKINGIEKSYIKDFKEALDTFEA